MSRESRVVEVVVLIVIQLLCVRVFVKRSSSAAKRRVVVVVLLLLSLLLLLLLETLLFKAVVFETHDFVYINADDDALSFVSFLLSCLFSLSLL